MKIIHRYLLREYLTYFLYCGAGFLVLLVGNFLFELSSILAGKRASFSFIALLVYYQIPYLWMDVFPAAVLFAVFLSLGRLAQSRELDVLRTAGWSFPVISAPLLGVTFFLLAEREFANNRTFWTCFNCGLEFEVWRDKKDS